MPETGYKRNCYNTTINDDCYDASKWLQLSQQPDNEKKCSCLFNKLHVTCDTARRRFYYLFQICIAD